MNKPVVNVENGKITITLDGRQVYTCDAGDGWDLGDDLLIASGRIWLEESGKPFNPEVEEGIIDQQWLDERAAGVLFTVDQMENLRELATSRGLTLPQLIREEMLATLAFATWDETIEDVPITRIVRMSPQVDVAEDAEGEDGDADADPAVPETEPQAEAVADTHGGGDQVQDDLENSHGN